MKRQEMVLWSIVLLALLSPRIGNAYNFGADEDTSYLGLKGIRTVALRLTGFYGDYERYGVYENRIRMAVEQRLQNAGLTVINAEEAFRMPGAALVQIDLRANYGTYGYYSYALGMKIKQKIPLASGAESFITETVWAEGTTGWVEDTQLDRVNNEITGLVDRFLTEHSAQNAGTGGATDHPAMTR